MIKATAFAPATVSNVAVGFDILGFAVAELGDEVCAFKTVKANLVEIESISGVVENLPLDSKYNTASVAAAELLKRGGADFGVSLSIKKGIPMGSGLGGSAASAVAAVVAVNSLLAIRLGEKDLLESALIGEAVASGDRHGDNVGPCLTGGMCLILAVNPVRILPINYPKQIFTVLVHPHIVVETKRARALLKKDISLRDHVKQSACLAGFLTGCFREDLKLVQEFMHDFIIEPQRAVLIPGFSSVKEAALKNGAIGCSISGSGPTVFAWTDSQNLAEKISKAMVKSFSESGHHCDTWISPISQKGAFLK